MTARTYVLLLVAAALACVLALIVTAPEPAERWTPATSGDAVPFQGEMPHG